MTSYPPGTERLYWRTDLAISDDQLESGLSTLERHDFTGETTC